MDNNKQQLRSYMTKARDEINVTDHKRWSEEACQHAAEWLTSIQAASFMVYAPFRSELDTRSLVEWGWQEGLSVYFPKCHRDDHSMTLHLVKSWEEMGRGAYGIPEPDEHIVPAAADDVVPQVILVPGLAFDRSGGRLGYGGGYYDRLAERLQMGQQQPASLWSGIGFELQVMATIPMVGHDTPMDWLITESGVIQCNKDGEVHGTNSFQ